MSTPVVTDRWAGIFDCHVCRRKRLMGDEFSKKALERFRKDGGPLKCKKCVQETEENERAAAASKRAVSSASNTTVENETRTCAGCNQITPIELFNKNQWNKGEGKSKCRRCVDAALANEAKSLQGSKEERLQAARVSVISAQASGNVHAILKAESELAALEAEVVTGLKPVKMSGRGSSRSRGGGRGRLNGRGRGGQR